jgi:hypothetical protein
MSSLSRKGQFASTSDVGLGGNGGGGEGKRLHPDTPAASASKAAAVVIFLPSIFINAPPIRPAPFSQR